MNANRKLVVLLFAVLAVIAVACAPAPTPVPPTAAPKLSPMEQLIADAKQEGQLTTIALPHDWANYGEILETYKTKYGIKLNELNPDAGSSD